MTVTYWISKFHSLSKSFSDLIKMSSLWFVTLTLSSTCFACSRRRSFCNISQVSRAWSCASEAKRVKNPEMIWKIQHSHQHFNLIISILTNIKIELRSAAFLRLIQQIAFFLLVPSEASSLNHNMVGKFWNLANLGRERNVNGVHVLVFVDEEFVLELVKSLMGFDQYRGSVCACWRGNR